MRSKLATAMIAASLMLVPAGHLLASDHKGSERNHDKWADALELTTEQRHELKTLRQAQKATLKGLDDRQQRHALKRAQRQELHAAMHDLLTDEQRAAAQAHARARHDERFERVARRLELTDEQQPIVRELMREGATEGRELMRSARERAQEEGHDRQAVRTQVREARAALQAQTRERLAEVLSDEQLARLDTMHEQHGGKHRKERRSSRRDA